MPKEYFNGNHSQLGIFQPTFHYFHSASHSTPHHGRRPTGQHAFHSQSISWCLFFCWLSCPEEIYFSFFGAEFCVLRMKGKFLEMPLLKHQYIQNITLRFVDPPTWQYLLNVLIIFIYLPLVHSCPSEPDLGTPSITLFQEFS